MKWLVGLGMLLLAAVSCAAQENTIDRIDAELRPLAPSERMLVLKIAENKITDHLGDLSKRAEHQKNPLWVMKATAFSYAILTTVLDRHFPDIALIYRERTELYSGWVRGKLTMARLKVLEPDNERRKAAAIEPHIIKLEKDPQMTNARVQALLDLGNQLGQQIVTIGKMRASS